MNPVLTWSAGLHKRVVVGQCAVSVVIQRSQSQGARSVGLDRCTEEVWWRKIHLLRPVLWRQGPWREWILCVMFRDVWGWIRISALRYSFPSCTKQTLTVWPTKRSIVFTQWTPAALCQTRFIIFVLCRAVNTSNATCFITSSLPFCLPSHHSITLLCLELCFPSANLFLASVMYWCKLINATLCGGPGIENTSIRDFRHEAYAYVREIVNNVNLLAPADHDETAAEPPNKHSRSEASAFKFLMGNCSASDQVSTVWSLCRIRPSISRPWQIGSGMVAT